jgi:hypothetical protein
MPDFGTLILVAAGAAAVICLSIDLAARKRRDTHVTLCIEYYAARGLAHQ